MRTMYKNANIVRICVQECNRSRRNVTILHADAFMRVYGRIRNVCKCNLEINLVTFMGENYYVYNCIKIYSNRFPSQYFLMLG